MINNLGKCYRCGSDIVTTDKYGKDGWAGKCRIGCLNSECEGYVGNSPVFSSIEEAIDAFYSFKTGPSGVIYNPSHYTSGNIETIDKIESVAQALEHAGVDAVTILRISHALKYFDRMGLKGSADNDVAKCANYLCRAVTGHWAKE